MTYQELKSVVLSKSLLWQYDQTARFYYITAHDGPIKYDATVYMDGCESDGVNIAQNTADREDFEANYKATANQSLDRRTADGLPSVCSTQGVDPKMACYCPSVIGKPTPANPNVDLPVENDSYWQLHGMHLDVEGAAPEDSITFQVGVFVGEAFVLISEYGNRKFVRSSDTFRQNSTKCSNPIPQGCVLRMSYSFKDPENPSTPLVSSTYHVLRPYA